MSYILEALKKVERERSLGQPPNLETRHIPTASSPRRIGSWLVMIALLANILLMAAIFLRKHTEPIAQAPQSPPPITQPTPQPAESMAASTGPPPTSAQVIPGTSPAPSAAPPTVRESDPPVAKARRTAPASTARAEPAPVLQSLPAELRRSLPALNLDIHVYSEAAAGRFVMINSTRYQEGDRLSEGPLLEAITSTGVVLRYQGQRFLLPVR
jgi:general secretion pathway protein B